MDKTICNTTEIRQNECEKMAETVDIMVVIGGKNSANTKKLVDISKANCEKVYWIQTVDDIKNEEFNSNQVVGIIAGASTPNSIIEEVKEFLENK